MNIKNRNRQNNKGQREYYFLPQLVPDDMEFQSGDAPTSDGSV